MQAFVEWTLLGVSIVAGLGGALLIARGVIGRRVGTGRACPRCRYDMQAIGGLRCPECGRVASGEAGLRPRRRSWRRVVLGVLALAVALPAFGMHHAARDMGWKSVVPDTAWIVAAGFSESPVPMEELGLDAPTFVDPASDLWSWQRSLLARAMRRRTGFDDVSTREIAFLTLSWLIMDDRVLSAADASVFDRLADDSAPGVRSLALSALAGRLDEPESDPRIRAALEATPGDLDVESTRMAVFHAVCDRYLGKPGEVPNRRVLELLHEFGAERRPRLPSLELIAPQLALMAADRGLLDPTLVEPMLASAAARAGSNSGVASRSLRAALRHADDRQRPLVFDAMREVVPKFPGGAAVALAHMAQDATLPGDVRATLLRSALGSRDRVSLEATLDACEELPDDLLPLIAESIMDAVARLEAPPEGPGCCSRTQLVRRVAAAVAKSGRVPTPTG